VHRLSQKSEVIRRVNREVKVFNEEDHLVGCKETILSLYRELRESIFSISSDVLVKPQKKYIAFVHNRNFLDIVVWNSSLSLYLNMKKGTLNDHQNMAGDVSKIGHWGNGDYEIKITKPTDIGYVLSLIRQSYDKN
jgi:predicted transport protein